MSGGSDSGQTSQITVDRQSLLRVDQAATVKQGNFTPCSTTRSWIRTGAGAQDAVTAVLNFADDGTDGKGAGMYLEGNIIHSAEALTRNYDPAQSTVTFNNNILPMPGAGRASGNSVGRSIAQRPRDIPTPTENELPPVAPAHLRAAVGLQSSSPALGTGPNGTDKGGVRPLRREPRRRAASGNNKPDQRHAHRRHRMTGNGIPATGPHFRMAPDGRITNGGSMAARGAPRRQCDADHA